MRRSTFRRLVATPIAAVLLVGGGKAATMSWFSARGADAYAAGRYVETESNFDRLVPLNVIAPWKAYLGIGDARHGRGNLAGAAAAFRRALELAPERCDVRFNLVVTLEAQADRIAGGEAREITDADRMDAFIRYRSALDIANELLCLPDGPGSPGERLAETRERLQDKLGGETMEGGEAVSPPDPLEPADDDIDDAADREQRLQERNQTGAANREPLTDLDPASVQPPDQSDW